MLPSSSDLTNGTDPVPPDDPCHESCSYAMNRASPALCLASAPTMYSRESGPLFGIGAHHVLIGRIGM